jgi:GNAT superfamily N-acetyltransferase
MSSAIPADDAPPVQPLSPRDWIGMASNRTRCRSFAFLEREGERWTVFLMTFPDARGQWRGYFAFRASSGASDLEDVRTADLFVEGSEAEVDARARGLGKPLLAALLESALHTRERRLATTSDNRLWFRQLLARHALELIPAEAAAAELPLAHHLESLYESYRLDQVAHLIALMDPDQFRATVEQSLEGRSIDFRARDRFQLAMLVVQELEALLPLPPFDVWLEDYMSHREEYERYAVALHRDQELP